LTLKLTIQADPFSKKNSLERATDQTESHRSAQMAQKTQICVRSAILGLEI